MEEESRGRKKEMSGKRTGKKGGQGEQEEGK